LAELLTLKIETATAKKMESVLHFRDNITTFRHNITTFPSNRKLLTPSHIKQRKLVEQTKHPTRKEKTVCPPDTI